MESIRKKFHVLKNDFVKAGEASIKMKNILKSVGCNSEIMRRVAICGYEAEMNLVMHGGDGELSVDINAERITVVVSDTGPGIEDTELALKEGYSTAKDEYREMGFGAGMGLPNMKRNSDDMTLNSEVGEGTCVTMIFNMKG